MNEPPADPPIPADGSCAHCGGVRRLKGLKPLYRGPARADPFCSTQCARAWHGVALPEIAPRERRAYVSQLPRAG